MPKMKVWNGTTWITLDANNADTVDGKHASDFAPSSHVGSGGSAHAVATSSVDGFMSASDKSKLDGIQAGAEVNQNAFSNVKIGNTTITADSKTDTLELVAGANITLTPDEVNDKVTISATVPVSDIQADMQEKANQAEQNAKTYADQQLAAHSVETASKFTSINLNIIDMAVELETLKGATLNGVTANIFVETFTNLNDINLMNGVYDSVNKRLVL